MILKTYVLMLSKVFPAYHSKAGQPTDFLRKLQSGEKIHTIRDNYTLWSQRIYEVQQGKAVLSIRQWEGKPYRSKQTEILRLTKIDGVGIQKLKFPVPPFVDYPIVNIDERQIAAIKLSANDGLSDEDWIKWFMPCNAYNPLAIIHFTRFRY